MIKKISLLNFRNLKELSLETDSNLIIFVGNNAVGKTSILESIYLTGTSKSHRTNNYLELINNDSDKSYVKIEANNELIVSLDKERKKYFINKREKKPLEFIGNIKTIMFSNQDLKIITGTKSDRRKFLDLSISMLHTNYLKELILYKKLLKKRNEVLKQKEINKILLNTLTSELIPVAKSINSTRIRFINKMNLLLGNITNDLNFEKIEIKHKITVDDLDLRYKESFNQDLKYKATTIGPHKDDLEILINGLDAKLYASNGQQRTVVICLKLALLKMTKESNFNEVILLLDDLFAELDSKRQKSLVNYLSQTQTFITTTSLLDIPNYLLENAKIIKI